MSYIGCSWDKTPWEKQLEGEGLTFAYSSAGYGPLWRDLNVRRNGRQLIISIYGSGSRKGKQEVGLGAKPSRPAPTDSLPPVRPPSTTNCYKLRNPSNSHIRGVLSVQTQEHVGDILQSNLLACVVDFRKADCVLCREEGILLCAIAKTPASHQSRTHAGLKR